MSSVPAKILGSVLAVAVPIAFLIAPLPEGAAPIARWMAVGGATFLATLVNIVIWAKWR